MAPIQPERLGVCPSTVTPLRITVRVERGLVKRLPIHLDALLMAVHARRADIQPPIRPADIIPIDIPIARSECGRVHLCSASISETHHHEKRHIHRRPPVLEYMLMAPKVNRVDIAKAEDKMYRLAVSLEHVDDAELTWFALGDREQLLELLSDVHYLGKYRGMGFGRRSEWSVESCDTWAGFPVVRDGKPLRNLPLDWPGLIDAPVAIRCVAPPYWMRELEVACAVPR